MQQYNVVESKERAPDVARERTEIYSSRTHAYQHAVRALDAWQGTRENKDLILAFQEHLFAQGTGESRVAKITTHLRGLCDLMPQCTLAQATKGDVRGLVARIHMSDAWGAHTKHDYTRVLRHFYRWYQEEDPRLTRGALEVREDARAFYIFIEKGVRSARPRNKIARDAILTNEDRALLILEGCKTPLERAMVAVLHESGVRIGEFLGLRILDYCRKRNYGILQLDGKTGERSVPIVESVPWLDAWLAIHPYRDDPEALLWVSVHPDHWGRPFTYASVRKVLARIFRRAGLRKQGNPHFFRHSRATLNAPHMSEAILCKYFGWTIGSATPRTYVHLAAQDVESAYARMHGINVSHATGFPTGTRGNHFLDIDPQRRSRI